jgi:hypothetical protein
MSANETQSNTLNMTRTNLFRPSNSLSIPPTTETTSESLQTTSLILLDIQQFLTARVPQRVVAHIFRAAVYGLRAGGALDERAAVGESDELGKGVWSLGAAHQRGVADLLCAGRGDAQARAGCVVEEHDGEEIG